MSVNLPMMQQTIPPKKNKAVRNGALIGAGVGTALQLNGLRLTHNAAQKAGITLSEKIAKMGGKGAYAALVLIGIGICTAIGTGIGAIVKACKKAPDDVAN